MIPVRKPSRLSKSGNNIAAAAAAVRNGGIVAYPTEGVFGLGCDPANLHAVTKLLSLKNRQADKGLILIAAERLQLSPYIAQQSQKIEQKLAATWPGPVTWILPCIDGSPELLTGGRTTIAARVTAYKPAAELCLQCGHALVSTSANVSGKAACTSATEVENIFNDDIDYVLQIPVGDLIGPTPIFDGVSGEQLR